MSEAESPEVCQRNPDKQLDLGGGIRLDRYVDVPITDAVTLIMCRRDDDEYWDDDIAQGSDSARCDVLIYYKQTGAG